MFGTIASERQSCRVGAEDVADCAGRERGDVCPVELGGAELCRVVGVGRLVWRRMEKEDRVVLGKRYCARSSCVERRLNRTMKVSWSCTVSGRNG